MSKQQPTSKPTSATTAVSRPRTQDEMQLAEERTRTLLDTSAMRPDDDHPADVLADMRRELLAARAGMEELRIDVLKWHAKFTRR